jgi:CDP-paratose 2-epimerase
MGKLQRRLGVSLNWKHIEARQSDQRVFIADHSKISSRIPWQPQVGVDAGLDRMLNWVRSNAA